MIPDDAKAMHCKVVCLIQLSSFKDALNLLNNSKYSSVTSAFHFEKAYVQYRLNFLKEALKTVDSAPELSPALKELRYLPFEFYLMMFIFNKQKKNRFQSSNIISLRTISRVFQTISRYR